MEYSMLDWWNCQGWLGLAPCHFTVPLVLWKGLGNVAKLLSDKGCGSIHSIWFDSWKLLHCFYELKMSKLMFILLDWWPRSMSGKLISSPWCLITNWVPTALTRRNDPSILGHLGIVKTKSQYRSLEIKFKWPKQNRSKQKSKKGFPKQQVTKQKWNKILELSSNPHNFYATTILGWPLYYVRVASEIPDPYNSWEAPSLPPFRLVTQSTLDNLFDQCLNVP